MERTPNKSQHTKLTLEKKILPPLPTGIRTRDPFDDESVILTNNYPGSLTSPVATLTDVIVPLLPKQEVVVPALRLV